VPLSLCVRAGAVPERPLRRVSHRRTVVSSEDDRKRCGDSGSSASEVIKCCVGHVPGQLPTNLMRACVCTYVCLNVYVRMREFLCVCMY
jgi:hypothetical protein